MKINQKGFTLIELLAVIVILAVVALIATPLIMGTITKAKKNAAIDSAYGYMRAMETSIGKIHVEDASKIMEQEEITFTVENNGASLVTDGATMEVNYKGSKPEDGGTLTYDKNGRVVRGTLTISGYEVKITNDKATIEN